MMNYSATNATLASWGEFRLIREVILPALRQQTENVSELGDDCAFISWNHPSGSSLVVTADAGPRPLAWHLGHESYRTWGWYAVVVNASDLASAGADPIAFVSSVEAPSDMLVPEFQDFFEGVAEACREFRLPSAGGNIRAASKFACHGMALGVARRRLGRGGCRPGDKIVAVGECGLFAAAYLWARERGLDVIDTDARDRILRPRPQLRQMAALQSAGVVSAASDNSDGVLGSLSNIAEASQCTIEMEMDDALVPLRVREAADHFGLDPWNLMLFWGDWQVVVAIPRARFDEFQLIARREEISYTTLATAHSGPPDLWGRRLEKRGRLKLLRNENFIANSYNVDPGAHLDHLFRTNVFMDES
jgi:thiamine-monophosphate kinase